jgi:hypothetical protein
MNLIDNPRAAWAHIYRRARLNRYNPKGRVAVLAIADDRARALGLSSVRFRVAPGVFQLLPRRDQVRLIS